MQFAWAARCIFRPEPSWRRTPRWVCRSVLAVRGWVRALRLRRAVLVRGGFLRKYAKTQRREGAGVVQAIRKPEVLDGVLDA